MTLDGYFLGVLTFKICPATTAGADHALHGAGGGHCPPTVIAFGTPETLKAQVRASLLSCADLLVWLPAGETLKPSGWAPKGYEGHTP